MRQKIIKEGQGKFRVFWEGQEQSALRLDFNPLLKHLNLSIPAVLLHWQGRPWGLRRWGVYCSDTDQYYGVDHDKLDLSNFPSKTFQIPEKQFKTLPTAVVIYFNCKVLFKENTIILI